MGLYEIMCQPQIDLANHIDEKAIQYVRDKHDVDLEKCEYITKETTTTFRNDTYENYKKNVEIYRTLFYLGMDISEKEKYNLDTFRKKCYKQATKEFNDEVKEEKAKLKEVVKGTRQIYYYETRAMREAIRERQQWEQEHPEEVRKEKTKKTLQTIGLALLLPLALTGCCI